MVEMNSSAAGVKTLPLAGQVVDVEPVGAGSRYVTTVLDVSDARHVLLELPGIEIPVSLRSPRDSQVILSIRHADGQLIRWLGRVKAFSNHGVGFEIERELDSTDRAPIRKEARSAR